MNPATAIEMANSINTHGDPVLEAAKWVFFIILLLGAASVPFMMILKKKNKDTNENQIESAISGAGSSLYNQLIKQVEEYRQIADKAFKERNDLFERVSKLEAMAESFKEAKVIVDRLRVKLDLKDQEIRHLLNQGAEERAKFLTILTNKDNEIIRRDQRISVLEKDMSKLQVRLARDEARQVFGNSMCPFKADAEHFDTGSIIPVHDVEDPTKTVPR